MKIYTTGQVGKLCNVATSTVNKWIDSGKLNAYRIPGSRHRRIPRDSLIEFLKDYGVPLGELEYDDVAKVLVVSSQQDLIDTLRRELTPAKSFKIAVAASGFSAGYLAEALCPHCVIIDFAVGRSESLRICENLRRKKSLADTVLIALSSDNEVADHPAINESFRKPFDVALLAERISTLLLGTTGLI